MHINVMKCLYKSRFRKLGNNITAWSFFVDLFSNQSSQKSIKKAIKGPMKTFYMRTTQNQSWCIIQFTELSSACNFIIQNVRWRPVLNLHRFKRRVICKSMADSCTRPWLQIISLNCTIICICKQLVPQQVLDHRVQHDWVEHLYLGARLCRQPNHPAGTPGACSQPSRGPHW